MDGKMNVDKEHLQVDEMFGAGVYSHAVRVGNLLFCSGMSAREPDGKVHSPGDPGEQARYCFEKLRRVLAAAGCSFRDVVKLTTYMVDPEHRVAIGAVRQEYFKDPLPASTGLVVKQLSDPALLYEVDAIAVIPER
jgi:enamine deaminase RidA (YjgF/YER057c/UK114 family)